MRFIVLPLLLCACAPESFDRLDLDGLEDMTAVLVDSPGTVFAERTRVLGGSRGMLSPGGEPLSGELAETVFESEQVVVDIGEQIGVIVDDSHWQLVVWLDRTDLVTVPVSYTWMSGVRVPPGLTLEILDHQGSQTRVGGGNHALEVDAWVEDSALDQFWYSDESPEPWEPDTTGEYAMVQYGVALLDAPLGEPFAWTLPAAEARISMTGHILERSRGHVRMEFVADGWPVEAWIHEDDVRTGMFGLRGYGSSSGCSGASCGWGYVHDNVLANTPLYSSPNGPVIGRTKVNQYLPLDGEAGDWPSTELSTEFGIATVFVDPEDLL